MRNILYIDFNNDEMVYKFPIIDNPDENLFGELRFFYLLPSTHFSLSLSFSLILY